MKLVQKQERICPMIKLSRDRRINPRYVLCFSVKEDTIIVEMASPGLDFMAFNLGDVQEAGHNCISTAVLHIISEVDRCNGR